jgi:hypothetical protein
LDPPIEIRGRKWLIGNSKYPQKTIGGADKKLN